MRKFEDIKFEIKLKEKYGKSGTVKIDLKHIEYLVETKYYSESIDVDDYIKKVVLLAENIQRLGEMIYDENKLIKFHYASGTSNIDDMFGIAISHSIIRSSNEYKYNYIISKDKLKSMQRDLKIKNILNTSKSNKNP